MRTVSLVGSMVLLGCVTPSPSRTPPVVVAPAAPVAVDAGVDAGAPSLDAGVPDAGPSTAGQPISANKRWSVKLEGVGTSSPRLVDLNGDRVLDVVLGGGVQGRAGWVYALDGATGAVLWRTRFKEEFYATPTLLDVNRDGVPDVGIGGRDFEWTTLNGKDGKPLWTLRKANPKADIPRRNFNGGLPVPDQDGDGVDDLLLSQGGSYDDDRRLPGRLFVVSAATGKLLVNAMFPDKRETYSIPALLDGNPLEVAAGSGGESLSGHLWRLALTADTPDTRWSVDSGTVGVIASPLVTVIDGERSVVSAMYDGTMVRLEAATGTVRWSSAKPGFDARASPAPGHFGGSGNTDFVISRSKGSYPTYKWQNVVTWLDGATGAVLDEADTGVFSSSSPVVADFDGDGLDETFSVSMNGFTIDEGSVKSTLTVYDGARGKKPRLTMQLKGAGNATPAIADLDGDGALDLVLTYFGLVERYRLEVTGAPRPVVRWGGFRGPQFNGVDARD
jgi:outer membrane protein assembly factor BamB